MMRRTGFKRPTLERKPTEHKPLPEHLRRSVSMGRVADLVVAAPKTVAQRNRALLDMAQGRACMLRAPGLLCSMPDTTVAAHSNLAEHGKAGARKADDHHSVWACWHCHTWLDQGSACAELKAQTFDAAMLRQLEAWKRVAACPAEPERLRQAARWALFQHGVAA